MRLILESFFGSGFQIRQYQSFLSQPHLQRGVMFLKMNFLDPKKSKPSVYYKTNEGYICDWSRNINIEKLSDQLNSFSVPTSYGALAELESFINATTSGIVLFMSNGKLLGIKEKLFK